MNAFDYFFTYSKNLDKNFVLASNEKVSFKDIYNDSLIIANFLVATIGRGKNVLLISPNSSYFIKVYLGILKSGNICIPVSATIEQGNLDHILESTNCPIAFRTIRNTLNLNIPASHIIDEIILEKIIKSDIFPEDSLEESFDGNNTAELIFTSGSTGLPKGVMLSHLNLISNTQSIIEYLELDSKDIICVVLPFYYCYGLSLLHTHLKTGGSIVLNNNFMFLGSVIADLKNYKCTGFSGVPSHFQILLRKSQSFSTTDFPDLRYVTQAGGKLHSVFIEEFNKAFPGINFFVMYGQTEATARLSFLQPQLLLKKKGSIGKGIPGVVLEIVNEDMNPVKNGQIGELVAKGANIMKGYYNDPDTTSQTLKDGWLLTGDLARRDDDGFIFLEGRKKEIIKVGGRRVSPKEIEEVILSVKEVIDCTIEGVYDEILGEGIKASIVIKNDCDKEAMRSKIRNVCSQQLASYKVPQLIYFENVINVTSSGKKVRNIPLTPKEI